MHVNTAQASYLDMVERMLPFQTGERSLNGGSLLVNRLPLNRFHSRSVLVHERSVRRVNAYDGVSLILPFNQGNQRSSRISLISQYIPWVELVSCEPCLTEYVRCSLGVVDVARADVSRDWQLGLAVNKQMEFPSEHKLAVTLRSLLDAPVSLFIGFLAFIAVRPCLRVVESSATRFPKAGRFE